MQSLGEEHSVKHTAKSQRKGTDVSYSANSGCVVSGPQRLQGEELRTRRAKAEFNANTVIVSPRAG